MGKFFFVDLDDCIVESSPLIQKAFDEKTQFKNKKLETLEHILASCQETYEKNFIEVQRAQACNEKPKLIGSVKIGSNDIMKVTTSVSELTQAQKEKNRLYRWYVKPLEISLEALEEARNNKEMFLEERDFFLENDNQVLIQDAVVDYRSIYNVLNLTPGAINMINDVINSNEYESCFCLSHHNGGREEYCKELFINNVTNCRLPFLGLRFHSSAHKDGERRSRSSKALYVIEKFDLDDLTGCVLVDDSTANLDDWVKYGGMAVLYRPISEDEEYEGNLEPHGDKYPRITRMDKAELDKALEFYNEKGKLLKKGV